MIIFDAPDEAATVRLGQALSAVLPDGAVVALNGMLGAGKTRLVQALAAAEGVPPEEITSPTFVLINEYQGRRPLYHFDAYRLRDADEFLNLGPEEYFATAGLVLVEWAQRVQDSLPLDRLNIDIATTGPTSRRFTLQASGPRHESALRVLRDLLNAQQLMV